MPITKNGKPVWDTRFDGKLKNRLTDETEKARLVPQTEITEITYKTEKPRLATDTETGKAVKPEKPVPGTEKRKNQLGGNRKTRFGIRKPETPVCGSPRKPKERKTVRPKRETGNTENPFAETEKPVRGNQKTRL